MTDADRKLIYESVSQAMRAFVDAVHADEEGRAGERQRFYLDARDLLMAAVKTLERYL